MSGDNPVSLSQEQLSSRGRSAWVLWLLALAVLCDMLLATRSIIVERQLHRALARSDSSMRSVIAERDLGKRERASLFRVLREAPVTKPFLIGRLAADSQLIALDRPMDGAYYLVSPQCRACAINFPFLDSLSKNRAFQVLAYSRDASVRDLREYAQELGSRMRFVADPSGYLDRITPRWATPLLIVVVGGQLRSLIPGRISDQDKVDLIRVAGVQ